MGDREEKDKTLAIRVKGNNKIETVKINDFVSKLKKEIDEKKII